METRTFASELQNLVITSEMVDKKLCKLNPTKSPGIDNVHPRLLKECHSELCDILATIFNKSICEGGLPQSWRNAQVSPIFKKGSKKKSENYRPVSLTSVVVKVLESLIRDQIVLHMESNNGFRAKHSCSY